ncbi:MAG TPA: hypothetical protein VKR06_30880 [Ktedonosporobacter sp.]|nr:hypothetical protein [Ktedonosporobacter sp.]
MLLSLVTLLAIASAIVVPTVLHGRTAAYASSGVTMFNGNRITLGPPLPLNLSTQHVAAMAQKQPRLPLTPRHRNQSLSTTQALAQLPGVASTQMQDRLLLHNFAGLNSVDTFNANGFVLEPPDQGLCIGFFQGQKAVGEIVNNAVAFYTPAGTLLVGPISLNGFFNEPASEFTIDPRCSYDPQTQAFFFTMLAADSTLTNHVDIGVLHQNGSGLVYQVDTTFANNTAGQCPCVADQPKFGIDKNNVYISVDQFDTTVTFETGAALMAISKSQLVAGTSAANGVEYLNLALNGIGITGLMPAVSTTTVGTEFLLNSFPFADAAQTRPNAVSNTLGLWSLPDAADLTLGQVPVLSARTITSELFGFPVPALTTNGLSLATFTDDDRMQQVQFINGHLWAALTSAVTVAGDPVTRDGAAWFEIEPQVESDQTISIRSLFTDQGYIASAGFYLINPAIAAANDGTVGVAFTLTNQKLDPSTGFIVRKAGARIFNHIHLSGRGAGPDIGFSCAQGAPQQCRWGDYSAVALDPNSNDIWMASENTVPQVQTLGPNNQTNWGTRIWDIDGE